MGNIIICVRMTRSERIIVTFILDEVIFIFGFVITFEVVFIFEVIFTFVFENIIIL